MEKYKVGGMSCAACSARVEKAVCALEGVESCAVNLLTGDLTVEGNVESQAVINAVVKAGYSAAKEGQKDDSDEAVSDNFAKETKLLRNRLIASVGFLILLMYISMGHSMWNWPLPSFLEGNAIAVGLLQLLVAAIVMVINQRFFINGALALLRRSPNMDTLVAMGSTAAFVYSTGVLFKMSAGSTAHHMLHGLYFESAAMIVTLVTVGKMLESISKGKTTSALKGLASLAPKRANVIRNGKEITVDIKELAVGDIFVVRPGESIATDGVVEEGITAVNESALTGESMPVDKGEGDRVSAGTINLSGFIKCRATQVGEDTTLSRIIKTVSDASSSKAPIAKAADKVSAVFVPSVMAIAIVATVVWLIAGRDVGFAIARGISVLVISCPCALGLATPVAIMVGNGVAAKNGVLFKTAQALEVAGRVKTVVLDKTGTLTKGQPEVSYLYSAKGSEEELVSYAASLEAKSEHPLAKAILKMAVEKGTSLYETENFEVMAGNGLTATIEGRRIYGGKWDFIKQYADIPADALAAAEGEADKGRTPLFFAFEGEFIGFISVADALKDDSADAVKALSEMGIRTVMLTGDNEKTANAVAAQAGIDEVVAGVLPNEKERAVAELCNGRKTAMVGDGINDAPALTRAHLGVAIGTGTDIAADAADVVVMKGSLMDVVTGLKLGRAVLRNIHQNLFWAFFYNAIGIPLAAGLFIPLFGWELEPMFGAAAMSLSSFCVVTNALRLNFFGNNKKTKIKEQRKMEITLNIQGMMCPHCEARVKQTLEAIPGVEKADVSHEKGTAVVTGQNISEDTLKNAVTAQGYKVL